MTVLKTAHRVARNYTANEVGFLELRSHFGEMAPLKKRLSNSDGSTTGSNPSTLTPAQKRAATIAAKKQKELASAAGSSLVPLFASAKAAVLGKGVEALADNPLPKVDDAAVAAITPVVSAVSGESTLESGVAVDVDVGIAQTQDAEDSAEGVDVRELEVATVVGSSLACASELHEVQEAPVVPLASASDDLAEPTDDLEEPTDGLDPAGSWVVKGVVCLAEPLCPWAS